MRRMQRKRRAKSFVLLPLLLVSFSLGACSRESSQNTEGEAKRVEVELGDGSLSFLLPEDFHELTGKDTTTRWSSHNGPQFAFGIEGATANIVVSLTDIRAEEFGNDDYVSGFLSGMAEATSRGVPGYVELRREVLEINGVNWARLEFQGNTGNSELHMDNYITCLSGLGLVVYVYATADLYGEYQQDLVTAIESFELRGGC